MWLLRRLSKRQQRRLFVTGVLILFVTLIFSTLATLFDEYGTAQIDDAARQQVAVERVLVSDVLAASAFIHASPPRLSAYYRYNNTLSDRIGAFRALPDTRDSRCSARFGRTAALDARISVVIAFHNEARSTLLRTLMSLVRRTAARYLHELIVIDDFSDDELLLPALGQLDFPPFTHGSIAPAVRSLRNEHRLGLIASRNRGARLATGDYLLFLDSHCEVNAGWLEPLLERVAGRGDGRTAASPVLDSIDAATLAYSASSTNLMGGFDWNLHFHWIRREARTAEDQNDAFRSPTFAGGIFLISRNWFFELNAFNALLEIWGGEAIEFSIKLWLCGGQIEIVPCSRVGHIFRQRHPFRFTRSGAAAAAGGAEDEELGQATYLRNSKVIAESWLDAYKYFFYAAKPAAKAVRVNISHTSLDHLKRQLQCRPFAWYLRHVYPQLKSPSDDFIAFGTLSSAGRCLQEATLSTHGHHTFRLTLGSCYRSDVTHWYLQRSSRQLHASNGACLDAARPAASDESSPLAVVLLHCTGSEAGARWQRRGAQLMHEATHWCLDNPRTDLVAISLCRELAPSQLFRFAIEMQEL